MVTRMCLIIDEQQYLTLEKCDFEKKSQKWKFSQYAVNNLDDAET